VDGGRVLGAVGVLDTAERAGRLLVALVWLTPRRKRFPWPAGRDLDEAPERRIAILGAFVERASVIGRMLERNLASIRYTRYDIFAGSTRTTSRPRGRWTKLPAATREFHLAMLPHAGPTPRATA